jgi:hypothetical protein
VDSAWFCYAASCMSKAHAARTRLHMGGEQTLQSRLNCETWLFTASAGLSQAFPHTASASMIRGTFKASKGRQTAETANLVHVQLKVIRLPHVLSDVVITMTTPMVVNEQSAAALDIGAGQKTLHHSAPALFDLMTDAFSISDWNLFAGS